MNLSQMTDEELMRSTKILVRQESDLLLTILNHLKEIDRRRLYSDFKQPGLLELVMSEFGYPRDQALRRILAMRMMREDPMIEAKIQSGKLNLTTIGIVQTLFSHQKKEGKPFSTQEKQTVIEQVCGKSTREAQRIVFSMSSAPLKLNEKIKMIAVDRYELTASIDEETVSIIESLKGLLAHSHPNISTGELIKMLGRIGLKELSRVKLGRHDKSIETVTSVQSDNPSQSIQSAKLAQSVRWSGSTNSCHQNSLAPSVKSVAAPRPSFADRTTPQHSDAYPAGRHSNDEMKRHPNKKVELQFSKAELKRRIWQRDDHKCTNCDSSFAIEADHRLPKAKGGQYTITNMRLLCRSCNQRAAIKEFGLIKMDPYLSNRRLVCATQERRRLTKPQNLSREELAGIRALKITD